DKNSQRRPSVNKAEKLFKKVEKEFQHYDLESAKPFLKGLSEGARRDVEDKNRSGYYQWLSCLVRVVKPRQIVELGGAMGASALMMLSELPEKSRLYSITLEEHGLEFSFVREKYPNFIPIVGDDLDFKVWPKGLDFKKTDIWFIDTEHTADQLRAELTLYGLHFKKGAIVLIDDIKLNDMFEVWKEITWDKYDATYHLHWSGFGICVI
ncbi:MAG: class I SAM-dependent methyltransferase, partial [Candidatus Hodarchaeota archaeon]